MKASTPTSIRRKSSKSASLSTGRMFEPLEDRTMRSVTPISMDHAATLAGQANSAITVALNKTEVVNTTQAAKPSFLTVPIRPIITPIGPISITKIPIVQTPLTQAESAISAKYNALTMGKSTSGVLAAPNGGYYQNFQDATIYWSSSTGAHELHGPILTKFLSAGGVAKLGYPTSDVTNVTNSAGQVVGSYATLKNDAAVYYQNRASQAYAISGPAYNQWLNNGGVFGFERIFGLPFGQPQGFPTSDSIHFANGQVGYFQTVKILNVNGGLQEMPIASSITYSSPYLTTSDPVGGTTKLTVNSDGTYALEYHFNDSSWFNLPYNYTVSVSLISPTGNVYVFSHSYRITDQDNGVITGKDPGIAANWKDLQDCKIVAQANASFSWSGLLGSLAKDIGEAASWFAKAVSEDGGGSNSGGDGTGDPGSDTGADTGDWGDDYLG
jgi:hypothetical protein